MKPHQRVLFAMLVFSSIALTIKNKVLFDKLTPLSLENESAACNALNNFLLYDEALPPTLRQSIEKDGISQVVFENCSFKSLELKLQADTTEINLFLEEVKKYNLIPKSDLAYFEEVETMLLDAFSKQLELLDGVSEEIIETVGFR